MNPERVQTRWFGLAPGLTVHECPDCYALVRSDRLAEHMQIVHGAVVRSVTP